MRALVACMVVLGALGFAIEASQGAAGPATLFALGTLGFSALLITMKG